MSTDLETPVHPPVVVGIDGSPSALQATRWAALHAAATGAPLRLIAAFGWPENTHHEVHTSSTDSTQHVRTYRDILLAMRTDHLDEAVLEARKTAPDVTLSHDVQVGHPVPVLCHAAAHAELLVVGSRGLGGVMTMALGSTAIGIAARAHCPVVVVRGEERPADARRPVVVGLDQTPSSESALAFGFGFASLHGAPLVAAHLVRFELGLLPVSDASLDTALDAERERLEERIARWAEKYPDVDARAVAARDHAASGLIELSRTAQLVVVGSRGRGGFAGQLLGSVSQGLLHHAHGPVAVVRSDG